MRLLSLSAVSLALLLGCSPSTVEQKAEIDSPTSDTSISVVETIDTNALEQSYKDAYSDADVGCEVQAPYVLCAITSAEFVSKQGLWIYEDGIFYAVNGKALTAAEKLGKERYPTAHEVDIPKVLAQF